MRLRGGLVYAIKAVQCELGRAAIISLVLTMALILAPACQNGGVSGGTDKTEEPRFYISTESPGASPQFSVTAPHCLPLESATLAGVGDADSITVEEGYVDFNFIFTVNSDLSQGETITIGPQCDVACQLFGWDSYITCGPFKVEPTPEKEKTLSFPLAIWNEDMFYAMLHQGNPIPNSGRVYFTIYGESSNGETAEATGYADFTVRCVEPGQ